VSIECEPHAIQEGCEIALARISARQHGVFTRSQALAVGVDASRIQRRVAAGLWERTYESVYRVVSVPRTWRQSLVIACFTWGPGSAVSHDAAASLRGLTGFEERVVELTVPRGRSRKGPGIVHRSTFLPTVDTEVFDAIPVTTVARTLIDVAGRAPHLTVEAALDDALYRRLTTRSKLRWRVNELARNGRPGVALIRELLDEREGMPSVPQNVFETRLLRVIRDGGLPKPETQHSIRIGGKVIATVDFAYPDLKLVIEADGRRFHSSRADFERDRERLNALAALGWRVLRITWTALTRRPAKVVDEITQAMTAPATAHATLARHD
jgi:very-short-patch-repair endonuclease